MKRPTNLLLTTVMLFCATLLSAQDIEYGVELGVGAGKLTTDAADFSSTFGLGFNASLVGSYFFNQQWGISTGLGYSHIASAFTGNYNGVAITGTDATGNFSILTYADDFRENITLNALTLPIGATYRGIINTQLSWRATAGLQFALPLSSTYELSSGISTRLYYPDIMGNQENQAIRNLPEWGYHEDYQGWSNSSGDLDTKISVGLYGQGGVVYALNEQMSLHTSVYLAYGLNNAVSNSNASELLTANADNDYLYNDPVDYTYHSPATFSNNHRLELGVKVACLFAWGNKKEQARQAELVALAEQAQQDSISNALAEQARQDSIAQALALEQARQDSIAEALAQQAFQDSIAQVLAEQQRLDALEALRVDSIMKAQEKALGVEVNLMFDTKTPQAGEEVQPLTGELCHIYFSQGSSDIDLGSVKSLDLLIELLEKNPDIKLVVEGHTSSEGSEKSNLYFGRQRAKKIADFLKEKCPDTIEIEQVSYGESQPIATNETEEGRTKNRRAVVLVKN